MDDFKNHETISNYLFGNQHKLYVAQYGRQQYLGDDTYTFGYIASYKEAADILVEKMNQICCFFLLYFAIGNI